MISTTIKIRNKAKAFWKHGKHKGAQQLSIKVNKEIKNKEIRRNRLKDMKSSIKELFSKK